MSAGPLYRLLLVPDDKLNDGEQYFKLFVMHDDINSAVRIFVHKYMCDRLGVLMNGTPDHLCYSDDPEVLRLSATRFCSHVKDAVQLYDSIYRPNQDALALHHDLYHMMPSL